MRNIVLDFILEREPWCHDVSALLEYAEEKSMCLYLNASTITDIAYLVKRECKKRGYHDATTQSREAVYYCTKYFRLIAVDLYQIQAALELNGPDFEDDLQIIAAVSAGCDAIITRDKSGYVHSPIPTYDPISFLKTVQH